MKKKLAVLCLAFASSAFSQDCSKLRPIDIDYLKSLSESKECLDDKFEFVISHEFGEILPLEKMSVNKKDFKKSVKFSGNTLVVNGQKLNASRVSVYTPPCRIEVDNSQMLRGGGFTPLSCNNQLRSLDVSKELSLSEALAAYEELNSPFYKNAVASCNEKARVTLNQKVEEYVKKNGGKIASSTSSMSNVTEFGTEKKDFLLFTDVEYKIKENQKEITLTLSYPLVDKSELSFSSPESDAFGQPIPPF